MTNLENVARAINEWVGTDEWSELSPKQQHVAMRAAKGAVAAIEVTEGMAKAALDEWDIYITTVKADKFDDLDGFRLAIAAALRAAAEPDAP